MRKIVAEKWNCGAHGAHLEGEWFSQLQAHDGQVWLNLREEKRNALREDKRWAHFPPTAEDCPARAAFHDRFAAAEETHPLSLDPSENAHMDAWNTAVGCRTDEEVNRLLSLDYGEEVEVVYCK